MSAESMNPTMVADLVQKALDHLWMHARPWDEMSRPGGVKIMTRAEGTQVFDIHGKSYFDLMAGLWLVNVGHGRREIVEAVNRQMQQLCYVNTWAYATLPAIELASKLAGLTPGSLGKVFFVNSGSEAVDSAVRMAKQYQFLSGFGKRYKIIARRNSYHGSSTGAQSVTGGGWFRRKYFEPMVPGVRHVPHPYCYRCQYELSYPDCRLLCARAIEQEIQFEDPETVAAVIGETIAGSSGVIPPPPEYWPMVRSICDQYGVLLVMDEVICGFGRTGRWFGCEHYGVVPDIMTVAKGLSSGYAPIAAAIARTEVADRFKGGFAEAFHHGITWGAHPVSCAAALANLEILERERLAEKADRTGKHLLDALGCLKSHPSVGDVRGKGMLAAVELVRDKKTKKSLERNSPFNEKLSKRLIERGVLTRVRNIIAIAPPLIATEREIDEVVEIIDRALGETEREFGMS